MKLPHKKDFLVWASFTTLVKFENRGHTENASNVVCPQYAEEIWKRGRSLILDVFQDNSVKEII